MDLAVVDDHIYIYLYVYRIYIICVFGQSVNRKVDFRGLHKHSTNINIIVFKGFWPYVGCKGQTAYCIEKFRELFGLRSF